MLFLFNNRSAISIWCTIRNTYLLKRTVLLPEQQAFSGRAWGWTDDGRWWWWWGRSSWSPWGRKDPPSETTPRQSWCWLGRFEFWREEWPPSATGLLASEGCQCLIRACSVCSLHCRRLQIRYKQQSQYLNDLYPFICLVTEDDIPATYCNCSTMIKNQFVTREEPTGQPLDEMKWHRRD